MMFITNEATEENGLFETLYIKWITKITNFTGPKFGGTDSLSSSFQTGFKLLLATVV